MTQKIVSLRFVLTMFAFAFCFVTTAGSQSSPYPMADRSFAVSVCPFFDQS